MIRLTTGGPGNRPSDEKSLRKTPGDRENQPSSVNPAASITSLAFSAAACQWPGAGPALRPLNFGIRARGGGARARRTTHQSEARLPKFTCPRHMSPWLRERRMRAICIAIALISHPHQTSSFPCSQILHGPLSPASQSFVSPPLLGYRVNQPTKWRRPEMFAANFKTTSMSEPR